jgi:hypothetical protein
MRDKRKFAQGHHSFVGLIRVSHYGVGRARRLPLPFESIHQAPDAGGASQPLCGIAEGGVHFREPDKKAVSKPVANHGRVADNMSFSTPHSPGASYRAPALNLEQLLTIHTRGGESHLIQFITLFKKSAGSARRRPGRNHGQDEQRGLTVAAPDR